MYIYAHELLFRYKGSDERGKMLLQYVCDHRINTEQQLTGKRLGKSNGVYIHVDETVVNTLYIHSLYIVFVHNLNAHKVHVQSYNTIIHV